MTYPEFRDLVLSWELPEEWAMRAWARWCDILKQVKPADVERAFRQSMAQVLAEAKHDAN